MGWVGTLVWSGDDDDDDDDEEGTPSSFSHPVILLESCSRLAAERFQPSKSLRLAATTAGGSMCSCCSSASGPWRSSRCDGSQLLSGGLCLMPSESARSLMSARVLLTSARHVSVCEVHRMKTCSTGGALCEDSSPRVNLSPHASSCSTDMGGLSVMGGTSPYGMAPSAACSASEHCFHDSSNGRDGGFTAVGLTTEAAVELEAEPEVR